MKVFRLPCLLFLVACTRETKPTPPPAGPDRVRVQVKLEAAPDGTRVNTFDSSVDQRMVVTLRVLRIVEGVFPDEFVVCSTHSTVLLTTDLCVGNGRSSSGGRETSIFELTLRWDQSRELYRLVDHRLIER